MLLFPSLCVTLPMLTVATSSSVMVPVAWLSYVTSALEIDDRFTTKVSVISTTLLLMIGTEIVWVSALVPVKVRVPEVKV